MFNKTIQRNLLRPPRYAQRKPARCLSLEHGTPVGGFFINTKSKEYEQFHSVGYDAGSHA